MERSKDEKRPPNVITSDTENATQVRPDEAPPHKRQKFERFRAYNTDTWNGPKRENKEVTYRQDNLHRYDALISSFGLTDYQQQRGRKFFDDLDLESFGRPIDYAIFAVAVVVANMDVDDGHRHWPHPDSNSTDEQFEEIASELGLSRRDQLSVVTRIRKSLGLEQVNQHDPEWDQA